MSKTYEYAEGTYHISFRLKGSPEKIALFHRIIYACESAWPFRNRKYTHNRVGVCSLCKGITVFNPRITPQDLKAAAAQVGANIRIHHFTLRDRCTGESTGWESMKYMDEKEAEKIYTAKPSRIHVVEGAIFIDDNQNQSKKDNEEDIVEGSGTVDISEKVEEKRVIVIPSMPVTIQ